MAIGSIMQLIEDIKTKLNLKGGVFIDMEIEEYIKDVPQDKHLEFFKALSGDEFSYKNPMDRISIVAKQFKKERTDNLLIGSKQQAKEMYDKFYLESCSMLDYTQKNREAIPNDREWFYSVKYDTLKRVDGTPTYSKQELYVLDELGGGNFLINIRFASNSKQVIDKIEKIISGAILTKYQNQKQLTDSRVSKMIKG